MEQLTSMKSVQILTGLYEKEGKPHLRLGQYFVNNYIKYSWPELYYEKDNKKALETISTYLYYLQYINELPTKVKR